MANQKSDLINIETGLFDQELKKLDEHLKKVTENLRLNSNKLEQYIDKLEACLKELLKSDNKSLLILIRDKPDAAESLYLESLTSSLDDIVNQSNGEFHYDVFKYNKDFIGRDIPRVICEYGLILFIYVHNFIDEPFDMWLKTLGKCKKRFEVLYPKTLK